MFSKVFTETQSLSPEQVTLTGKTRLIWGGTPEGWLGRRGGEIEQKDRNRHIHHTFDYSD